MSNQASAGQDANPITLTNSTATSYAQNGEIMSSTSLCHCVAFRLDDIQDYFLDNVQSEIIRKFEANNSSLTIGIIGHYFGQDKKLVQFVNDSLGQSKRTNFTIEIANHGWNHEDFATLNQDAQYSLMLESNQKIHDILGITPTVFIPPYNRFDEGTLHAANETGIQYISSNATLGNSIHPDYYSNLIVAPYQSTTQRLGISLLPSLASTGDLSPDNNLWLGYKSNQTFNALQKSVDQLGFAVVTMHPQEYSLRDGLNYTNQVDEEQMHELQLLIEKIHQTDLKIVTISEIQVMPQPAISSTPEFSTDFLLIYVLPIILIIATKPILMRLHKYTI